MASFRDLNLNNISTRRDFIFIISIFSRLKYKIIWGSCIFVASFNVPQKGCGTVSQSGYKKSNNVNTFQRSLDVQPAAAQLENEEISLENTIVIQHDPDFQEAGDTARRLRCVWGAHSLQKSVNAKMPEVYQPSTVNI